MCFDIHASDTLNEHTAQYNSFCNTASGAQDAIAVHRVATMQCLCPVITASANAPAKLNAACV